MDENKNPMSHSPLGKRKALPDDDEDPVQEKRSRLVGDGHLNPKRNGVSVLQKTSPEVAGRIAGIELENFMCHSNLKIDFNVKDNNCFYIGGPNGSGKSALFAAMNIGLGGRGNHNDRGNSVKGYIKEGQTRAKIRVILTNKGEGRIDKYKGDFIIVERTITQSATTYSLKSPTTNNRDRHLEVVSTKKTDLDAILARFGIELNNPIYWMSQDRSRHFLQKMDPSKLYEIFMKATELESTAESYEKCEEIHNEIQKILQNLKKDIGTQQKEIEKWKDDKNRVKKQLDLMKELEQLLFFSQWAPVRDAEQDLKHWENMQKQIKNTIASVNQQQYQNGVDQEFARVQLQELNAKIKEHKVVVDQYRDALKKINEDLRIQKKQASLIEGNIQKIQNEIVDAEKNIEEAVRRAETNATLKELTANKNRVDKLLKMEIEVSDQRRAVEREIGELKAQEGTMKREQRETNSYFYELTTRYNDMRQYLQKYDASQKDKMAKFGDKMATIMQLIQKNSNLFEKQPKGPLGVYITVRDPKWLLAVEEALRSQLSCFIFNSKKDVDVFNRIIREANNRGAQIIPPNTIVTKFGLPAHNTAPYEPSREYKTILREIDIKDVDVRNAFIDLTGIESHLLFETDDEARNIMYGKCPANSTKGQTASGAQVFGSNARGMGQYRFYACRRNRAVILTNNATSDKKVLEQEFEIYARKREVAGKNRQEAESRYKQWNEKLERLRAKEQAMERELRHMKEEIRTLRRKNDELEGKEDDDQIIVNLRASIDDLEERIRSWEDKKKEQMDHLDEIDEVIRKKEEEHAALSSEMTDYVDEFLPQQDEVMALDIKIKAYARMDEDCADKVRRMKEDLKHREEQRVAKLRAVEAARKKANEYKEKNPGCFDDPNLEDLPATEFLVRGCIEKEAAVKALKEQMVNLPSNEEMAKRKELYNKAKLLYTQLRMLFIQIQDCFKVRKESFPVIRTAITMRLKKTFRRLIKIRFHGTLEVDDEKKEIRISVQPHKTANEGVKDLKGLSGGERSYTTACFVMSLWDIMEAPFRCMDEFDVFMDMINRKVVMDLLVRLATEEYPHHQFLFFTPQGINELGEKKRVEIYEMPKVRP